VLDVVVDLRRHSPTYGQSTSVELSAENRLLFFIPTGFAHGFVSLRDDSCMIYKTNAVYAPENDTGIRWDSFGFAWPVSEVVVSERDRGLPALGESPAFF
jgi:dTDP-4-dehydrorhamnose 3,5-epimerase